MPIDESKRQRDAAMDDAFAFHKHLSDCVGLSHSDAARAMIGCGIFLIAEDLPFDEAIEHLDDVRRALDDAEDELLAKRS